MTSGPRFSTSEEGGIQLPALMTVARLGWRYLSRVEVEAQRRGRLDNIVLEDVLAERMMAMNSVRQRGRTYPVTESAVREGIERFKGLAADLSQGLLTANSTATDMLRLGTSVDMTVDGETKGRQLKFIDWDDLSANRFHMTAEFPVRRERRDDTRRPDIVLFVNGIPLVVIEVKRSSIGVAEGISQTIRNQNPDGEIPRLFVPAQLLIAANDSEPRYATTGTSAPFWAHWREEEMTEGELHAAINRGLDPEETARIWTDFSHHRRAHEGLMDPGAGGRFPHELDRTLVGLCSPERLLPIIRGFTLFDNGIKKVARYQQFFGVRRTMERVQHLDHDGRRKGGVIWHTQGSGKSLTMVMLAGAIEREFPKARLVLVTDRTDLDDQLTKTFRHTGKEPEQAATGAELIRLLRDKRPVITTLIHKFRSGLTAAGNFSDPDADIFVLVDESHRSQTVTDIDSLHRQMRKILPGAAYVGFTGTPLLKKEKSTFDRFGGLIHDYKIDRAVKDKAVVRLLYEGRHVDMDVQESQLDKWFDRATKDLSTEQKADLKRKMARTNIVQGVQPWLREMAWDVSNDFQQNLAGTPYRAQLVAPWKREAVLLKRMLDEIGLVTSEVIISDVDERTGHDRVGADDDDDVVKAYLKEVTALHSLKEFEKGTIRAFIAGTGPDVLIVVDKLLTGFDAPRNQTLYLAKKLSDHKLLQAIARVNRLFSSSEETEDGHPLHEKEHGRIVDYVGILGELDQALTDYSAFDGYDEEDVAEAVQSIRDEVAKLPDRHAALLDLFKGVANTFDMEAYQRHLRDEVVRKRFYDRLSAFARTLQTAFSSQSFIDNTSESAIANYKSDLKRFEELRRAVRLRYGEAAEDYDYRRYQAAIRTLLDKHIDTSDIIPIVPPVDIFDNESFKQAVEQQTGSSASVADTILSAATRTITERMQDDPALYRRFAAMVKAIIDEFKANRLSEAEYLAKAQAIRGEMVSKAGGKADDLPAGVQGNPMLGAFYRQALDDMQDISGDASPMIAELIAKDFFTIIERHKRVGWTNDPDVEQAMRQEMDDFLFDEIRDRQGQYGLDEAKMDQLMDAALKIAKRRADS
ncbi:HsdR family type I site-specific deoxyribonuclease [Erythrobacteraceae bacterium WH01K]|nr:HsdR family type I site-specific deoxyribonuclease [Erythrobacteraceae bacterium WH01K]